jgi:Ca-activated chloride channel family protein
MKTKNLLFFVLIFSLCGFDLPETLTITGRVTSSLDGSALPGVSVVIKGTSVGTQTDGDGKYSITVAPGTTLVFSFISLRTKEIKVETSNVIDVVLEPDATTLDEVVVVAGSLTVQRRELGNQATTVNAADVTQGYSSNSMAGLSGKSPGLLVSKGKKNKSKRIQQAQPEDTDEYNNEEYEGVTENLFQNSYQNPLSTFSIDVDAASYSNVRRFINNAQRPPKDAVRIEEMINYFNYDYDQPTGDHPFNIITEISSSPWNKKHKLVSVGLQGKSIPTENLPASNLVFLIDVSGSMSDPNKLPLLKASFKMLVNELREQDYVSIVVYSGAAGLVLEPTSGADKERIIVAMDNLQAGGSTAGGAGITLAYKIAKENFKKNGNNRVILATDGDFNVGASDNQRMEELIEEKRKDGIFLTVLGYGMGNYKDSKMEILADKGNGNYAYIDNLTEARKVLVNEFGGTLFTIAKDVKLQVEFNPAKVKAYRLIGYENRMLKSEDFNNDKKDAGELGSGHTVTALYEIIPVGVESEFYKVDELKYQKTKIDPAAADSKELMTVKFRYKKPDGDVSKLIVHPLVDNQVALENTSDNFRWAASVAAFGMLLRESEYVNSYSYDKVIELAEGARGNDKEGYRIEFINLVKSFDGVMAKR